MNDISSAFATLALTFEAASDPSKTNGDYNRVTSMLKAHLGLQAAPGHRSPINYEHREQRRATGRRGAQGMSKEERDTSSTNQGDMFRGSSNIEIQGGQFNAAKSQQQLGAVNIHILGPSSSNHSPAEDAPVDTPMTENFNAQAFNSGSGSRQEGVHSVGTDQKERNPATLGPAKKSRDIYYTHIGVQGRGSPLWIPEPSENLHIEYRRNGIAIGDVGIITEYGAFDFLFNICRPRDDPINPPNLPASFTTLEIAPMDISKYTLFGSGSYISSSTIQKVEQGLPNMTFKTDASEGAILIIPNGSESEDVGNVRHVRQFIAKHAEDWYLYALKVRGRDAQNGDLRVVIGYDKTTSWGMATFSHSTFQERPSLLKFLSAGDGRFATPYQSYVWQISGTAQVRTGPDPRQIEAIRQGDTSQDNKAYLNQTLFVRTMNITLKKLTWERLVACSGDSGEESPLEHMHSDFRDGHPSKGINEILLKDNPNAKMAITEDKDWISLLKDDKTLPPIEELTKRFQRRKGSFLQNEGGVVYPIREEPHSLLSGPAAQVGYGLQSPFPVKSPVEIRAANYQNDTGKLKDVIILVMGPTGAGKSTFINYLLPQGSDKCMRVNNSLTSEANSKAAQIDLFSNHPQIRGRRLLLLDTPGFDDTHLDDAKILEHIGDNLKNVHSEQSVLGGVIYLQDISLDRFSAAADRSLRILERLTGQAALRNVVLGTTKWSRESGGRCQRHELQLRNECWKPLITRGSVMLRFDDSKESAQEFVETILNRTGDHGIDLNIEREVENQKARNKKEAGKAKEGFFKRIRRFFSFKRRELLTQ